MLNARSLVNKIDLFQSTVYNHNPDIIGITETWCNTNVLDAELQLTGYEFFRCDRKTQNKGGGVLLYVKKELKPVEYEISTAFVDQIFCKVGNLVIGVCYRSSNYSIVGYTNNSNLCQLIQNISDKHFLLMGDFNYPDINWVHQTVEDNATVDCREFFNCCNDCFLSQHVSEYTRGNALLDLVFSREPDLVSNVKVTGNFGNSDHNMVAFNIQHKQDSFATKRHIRDYNKGDYESIREELKQIDWDVCMSGDTTECWNSFKKTLLGLEEKYIPFKKYRKVNGSKIKPLWMTNKALKCVRRKNRVYRKYKNCDHPAVKAAHRQVTKEIKKAKRNFEKKLADNIKQDSKSFFAYARSKSKCKTETGVLCDDNDTVLKSDIEIAEHFNRYFASVFTREDYSNPPVANYMGDSHIISEELQFDASSVLTAISKLNPDKSMGPDGLAPKLILETKEQISYPLYLLFKKSLQDTVIPDDWKLATVSPIFKKGNRHKAENYRPVSLTSIICKLFESIIRDHLVHYLESNILINNSQHGFRKGRSCLTNLLEFLDKVTGCVDSGENVDVIFLDFAKAFDKVPYKRLMLKLESHGITGKVALWIEEWLNNRMQCVGIRGTLSNLVHVLSGVPQGSVLGPLLFLIYINDLDCNIQNWILKFADDTKIFGKITDEMDRVKLQQDLQKLITWSDEWQMMFNVSKCKIMHIGKKDISGHYFMKSQQLEEVMEEKDLGVMITRDLKVSRQCQLAYNKASRILGLINRTIEYKHPDILIRLYKSLVRPHLEYSIAAWSPHYIKDKDLLERIQRRFTRMIPTMRSLSYEERLAETGLWTLEDRRVRADLIEVYKIMHGLSPVNFNTFFEYSTNSNTRGHSLKLHKRRVHTDLRQHFFTERVINNWNSLNEEIVSAISINSFKRKLQKIYMDGSFQRLVKSA